MSECVDLVIKMARERGLNPPPNEMKALIREFEKQLAIRPVMGPDRLRVAA
jgi:hypothetical protein